MNPARNSRLAGVLLSGLGLFGCSSGLEGVEKRLGSMREEITALQNRNDRLVERMDALEVKHARAGSGPSAQAAPSSGTTERPPLKVVRLVPGGEPGAPPTGDVASSEAADNPAPRTVIRGRGQVVEGRLASGELMPQAGEAEPARRRKSSGADGVSSQTKSGDSPKKGD